MRGILMKKVQLSYGDYYDERLMKPIRKQEECVLLILELLNILLIGEVVGNEKGLIMIIVDKMSRLFCFSDNKYFSMVFPFAIDTTEGKNIPYRIYDPILDIEIDNRLIALMKRMLNQIDFVKNTIDEIIEKAYFDVSSEEYTEGEVEKCFNIILRLLSMETGYIRYDYDPDHENGTLHPLYHFDVNYSSKGTYKMGINKKMEKEDFVDLLDIKTKCHYIL